MKTYTLSHSILRRLDKGIISNISTKNAFYKRIDIIFLLKHTFFMIKITPEELVRYLYNETSEQKTAKIKAALETDWNLRDTYNKLAGAQKNLNEITLSPRAKTVDKILEYASKKQQVQETSR